jgi:hypothetical protein
VTSTVQEALAPLLSEEDGASGLLHYIDAVEGTIALANSDLEIVRIQRDRDGNIIVATTRKLPNLRFNLGDLLLEAAGGGLMAAGAMGHPFPLVVAGLRFLRAVRKLSTLDIRQQDAEMLIAIFRLTQEAAFTNRRVRVDDLSSLLADKWDAAGIARSLERLELLACIEMGMEGIILNETIVVSQME